MFNQYLILIEIQMAIINHYSEWGLYIQLYSIHGLIRGHNIELGRDADTGGQVKYVVELGNALSKHPRVDKVELITRGINDRNVSPDYSILIEEINDNKMVRLEWRISDKGKKGIFIQIFYLINFFQNNPNELMNLGSCLIIVSISL